MFYRYTTYRGSSLERDSREEPNKGIPVKGRQTVNKNY